MSSQDENGPGMMDENGPGMMAREGRGQTRTSDFEPLSSVDVQSGVDDAVLRTGFHGTGAQLQINPYIVPTASTSQSIALLWEVGSVVETYRMPRRRSCRKWIQILLFTSVNWKKLSIRLTILPNRRIDSLIIFLIIHDPLPLALPALPRVLLPTRTILTSSENQRQSPLAVLDRRRFATRWELRMHSGDFAPEEGHPTG